MIESIRQAIFAALNSMASLGVLDSISLPLLAGAALLLALGLLAVRITRAVVKRLFERAAKLPAWGRMDPRRLARSAQLVDTVLSWIIFFLTLGVAGEVLGLPFLSHLSEGFARYVPRITGTILILLAGYILGRLLRDVIASMAAATAGAARAGLFGNIAMYVVFVVTLLIAADQTGVNISFLTQLILIVLGALLFGAALSFALGASGQISNILAAYNIQNIYRIGQRIRIDVYEGRILNISATGVTLDTAGGRVYVPARKFMENESTLLREDDADVS